MLIRSLTFRLPAPSLRRPDLHEHGHRCLLHTGRRDGNVPALRSTADIWFGLRGSRRCRSRDARQEGEEGGHGYPTKPKGRCSLLVPICSSSWKEEGVRSEGWVRERN